MPRHLRRTKIIATLGPASEDLETMTRMIEAGMDVARFNLSHGARAEHLARLETLRRAESRTEGRRVGVLFDLRGPEIRLGTFEDGPVTLTDGRLFTFTTERVPGGPERVSVDYPGLPSLCRPGDVVLLDDGNLSLEVVEVRERDVVCRVLSGGVLGDRKKLNLPGRNLDVPYLSPKDAEDLETAVSVGADFVAASYTRTAEDIVLVRDFLRARGGRQMVVAKIECQAALDNLDDIIAACDAVMVARGDLGVEVPEEDVPVIQKDIIARAVRAGRPVITATQMLESMVSRPRPTRAEASDVANAILDGTDAVMLSGETAVGRYPVEAVRIMARIAERADAALINSRPREYLHSQARRTITDSIGFATCQAAQDLEASAIIAATQSGQTARMIARYRPGPPVIAATTDERVARRLALSWGVRSMVVQRAANTDEMIDMSVDAALERGLIQEGEVVLITAGIPTGIPGTTNMLKVHTVSKIIARGTGIGKEAVTGRVTVARDAEEALGKMRRGDILVTTATDREFVPSMKKAAGLVVEEGGLTSHAAVAALSLGIPAVVGVAGAVRSFSDGQIVTIDPRRGVVYRGSARVL
ncbi:MAG TPA: pyruvate kinase [Clostridiales bacterium]|nr:pyruvate kinase [Clostridiales bacterium]